MTKKQKRILRLKEVQRRTGKSRSGIYLGEQGGTFPRHVVIGPRSIGWLEEEIDSWIDARAAQRGKALGVHRRSTSEPVVSEAA